MDSTHLPPDWTFTHEEVSNGVYTVRLVSRHGPAVEMTGSDLEALRQQAIDATKDIEQQLAEVSAKRIKNTAYTIRPENAPNPNPSAPMWTETDNTLTRTFRFPDFKTAFSFMTDVAEEAEHQQHHPWWSNEYNVVSFRLRTHDAGNIVTEKDHALAAAIDQLATEYGGEVN